jgi:hypothetical protein
MLVGLLVLMLNQLVLVRLVGNQFVSDGFAIRRPAGWFAYMIIASITVSGLGSGWLS